jgi:hypothetical protein
MPVYSTIWEFGCREEEKRVIEREREIIILKSTLTGRDGNTTIMFTYIFFYKK